MKVEPVRPKAFLDIRIDEKDIGRIVVELYDDLAPKSVENFLNLCKGSHKLDNETLTYKNKIFHRVIKNFVIQSGDVKYGNHVKESSTTEENPLKKVGNGNFSTFESNGLFEDENLEEPLDEPFKLCMANNGQKNSNGCQFFITTFPQPHLNGKHSVFGKVVHGKSVVREVENVKTTNENLPTAENIVYIKDCGVWDESMEVPIFNASYNQVGGDIFEEFPDDDSHIDKDSSESVFEASTKIKESGGIIFKSGDFQNALFKYRKCLRYVMEYIPDQDQEPEWYIKYYELKKKLYLNLALVTFKLKDYQRSINYSVYLLESDNLTKEEKAKGHFRRASSLLELKKYQEALKDFKAAKELVPTDKAISAGFTRCEELLEGKKKQEKAKYSKFFS